MNFVYIAVGAFAAVFEDNRALREGIAMERDACAQLRQQRDSYDEDRRNLLNQLSQVAVLLHQVGYNIVVDDNGTVKLVELSLGEDPLKADSDDAVE